MKDSVKKLARGQMVYAPITSTERTSKSPFADSKKISTNAKLQSYQQAQSTYLPSQSTQQSPIQTSQQQSSIIKNSLLTSSNYNEHQEQMQQLVKENELLKSREQIYVSKLLKLQQGLQRQHEEFMNLQQLYTQLFNVYKQKEQQIAELEIKYKQAERERVQLNNNSFSRREINNSIMSIDKMNSIKNSFVEENFKNQLTQLIIQNKRLNETNEKLIAELNYLKSKEKLQDSRQNLQQKVFDEINDWQKKVNLEKEEKIKLDYENKFFKLRIEDLEKTIAELEKIVSMKQTEIIKMREEKLHVRRQSSEKIFNRSPPKSALDSARSKNGSQENKKFVRVIENLQKENHRLREQNLQLKQKVKSTIFLKQSSRLSDSYYSSGVQNLTSMQKKLDFGQTDDKMNQNSLRSYQNENFNSQNINEQYFSFSRERDDKASSEEDLPTFPMDLEIEGIIRKHEQNNRQIRDEQDFSAQVQGMV